MLKSRASDELETLSLEQLERLGFLIDVISAYPESINVVEIPPDDREYHLLNSFRQFFKSLPDRLRRR